jgi:glycosyltransferase involved in cell wall biosynthesis
MKTNTKNNNLIKEGDVLVCVPRTNNGGGANYFNALKDLLPSNIVYFYRGKPNWPESRGDLFEFFRIIKDFFTYIYILFRWNYKIVHINTFFGGQGVYRDAIFILLAKIMRKKLIVFFRGWDWKFSAKKRNILFRLIKYIYLKSNALIVLSSDEKRQLNSWGYSGLIFSETTTVDWRLVQGISADSIVDKYNRNSGINLLFLSRIHKDKGIYETADAFQILQKKYPNLQLTIAGNGPELENARNYVYHNDIKNIIFKGFVQGIEKKKLFLNSHLFILPSFSEGMPNSVLEAFAFGLPVITTPVGGLKDIFESNVNGFLVKTKDVYDLKEKIQTLIDDKQMMKRVSITNYEYAREKFLSTKVAKRIEDIYRDVVLMK